MVVLLSHTQHQQRTKQVDHYLYVLSIDLVITRLAELKKCSESIGQDALKFLQLLKKEKPGSGNIAASANDIQKSIRQLERFAGVSPHVTALSRNWIIVKDHQLVCS